MQEYSFSLVISRHSVTVKTIKFFSDIDNALDIFWMACNQDYRVDLYLDSRLYMTRESDGTSYYQSRVDLKDSISFKIAK